MLRCMYLIYCQTQLPAVDGSTAAKSVITEARAALAPLLSGGTKGGHWPSQMKINARHEGAAASIEWLL